MNLPIPACFVQRLIIFFIIVSCERPKVLRRSCKLQHVVNSSIQRSIHPTCVAPTACSVIALIGSSFLGGKEGASVLLKQFFWVCGMPEDQASVLLGVQCERGTTTEHEAIGCHIIHMNCYIVLLSYDVLYIYIHRILE